nr:glycosyltransferase family 2 protein [Bacilli bacterium]
MSKAINDMPLISIVVPIYNVEKYLAKCIETIINQTYRNIELILVDDESPDNCGKICDEYKKKDPRITVIHKKNGGLSDARNKGIEKATGKYITFIDSDDYITLDYIETLFNSLSKNNADMAIGGHYIKYEKGGETTKYDTKEYVGNSELILDKLLYDELDVSAWAKLYKKELFNKIKFPVGRLYEDSATTYKLVDESKVIAVNTKPIYYYIIKPNSITNCSFNKKKLDLITSTEEMVNYISYKYPQLLSGCNRRMMYAYLSTYTQLNKDNKRYKDIEKRLVSYIKKHKDAVLKDKRVSKRDKIGIICACLGYHFYKISWGIYTKITNKKYE